MELVERPLKEAMRGEGMHLALLMALRLQRAWGASLTVVAVAANPETEAGAALFLAELFDLARVPKAVQRLVMTGDVEDCMQRAEQSDLDVLALPPEPDVERVRRLVSVTRSACLFFGDSGQESAVA